GFARGTIGPEQRVLELKTDRARDLAADDGEKEHPAGDLVANAAGIELAVLPHHDAERVHPRGRFPDHLIDDGHVVRHRLTDRDPVHAAGYQAAAGAWRRRVSSSANKTSASHTATKPATRERPNGSW